MLYNFSLIFAINTVRQCEKFSRVNRLNIPCVSALRDQRRTMFWFAARTAWMVTKTASGLILTRTAGDKFRAVKNLILTKPTEAGLKPATNYIASYFAQRAIPNGANKLRNSLLNIARLIYGTVLSLLTYLAIELYNVGHILVSETSKHLIALFNFGRELLMKLVGPLSDLMMVAYTVAYLLALAFVAYVVFRLIHHTLHSLFGFRSVMRAIVDTVTGQVEEEQKIDHTAFFNKVKSFFDNSALSGELNFHQLDNGAIVVTKAASFEESYLGKQLAETKKSEEQYQRENLIVSNAKKKK